MTHEDMSHEPSEEETRELLDDVTHTRDAEGRCWLSGGGFSGLPCSVDHDADDDGFPPIRFSLRNLDGQANEIRIHQHMLGMGVYMLVLPGEETIQVEGSHLDMTEVATITALILASVLQGGHVTDPQTLEGIRELIDAGFEGPLEEVKET